MNPTTTTQPESIENRPASEQNLPQGNGIAEDLKSGVDELAHTAKDAGSSFVREQQEKIADKIEGYSSAIEAICDKLASEGESESPLIRPANTASRQLHRASDYLHSHDFEDVVRDLGDLARRRPELVFGGLFIAGLASMRFLKASARRQPRSRRVGRPRWSEDKDTTFARRSAEPTLYPGPQETYVPAMQTEAGEFNNPMP